MKPSLEQDLRFVLSGAFLRSAFLRFIGQRLNMMTFWPLATQISILFA